MDVGSDKSPKKESSDENNPPKANWTGKEGIRKPKSREGRRELPVPELCAVASSGEQYSSIYLANLICKDFN